MMNQSLVILAAGKGTRFSPLTSSVAKPLIRVANIPILQHQIEAAFPYISEIILVVGYLQEKIKDYFGNSYKGIPIKYVYQKTQLGTGDALRYLQNEITEESFFIIYGDDMYDTSLFKKMYLEKDAVIGVQVKNWQNFGIFKVGKENQLLGITEKPKEFVGDVANIGMYKVTKDIFKYLEKMKITERNEFELTDVISFYAKDHTVEVIKVTAGWTPLTYSWHVLDATEQILQSAQTEVKGIIEPGATVKGTLILGEGSIIKAGSYLEGNFIIGKNCIIGPNAFLYGFAAIGDNSMVGFGVQVTKSVIGEKVNLRHMAFVGDSILGNNIKFSAGSITSTRRNDDMNVEVEINGKLVDTKRKALGVIVGDNARTGINTLIYAGRRIMNNTSTKPGEIIIHDKTADSEDL